MFLRQITDAALAQNAYLIGCQKTGEALLVDPERDVDRYLKLAAENDLRITAVADTHIHADYLSGARELVERHGVKGYFSKEGGADWQFEWALNHPLATLIAGGDRFHIGNIEIQALLTAGHTPEHLSFLITDHGSGATEPMGLLTGDFIFVGDVGRPDLLESAAGHKGVMESSARSLYASLRQTGSLPEHLQILPAHGAGSACGKALGAIPVSVLGYERKYNAPFKLALEGDEEDFVDDILSGQPEPPLYFARMKRDNRAGPALLPEGGLPSPAHIALSQVSDYVSQSGAVVLDLRQDREAFIKRHIRGALFAPLKGGKLPVAAGSYAAEDDQFLLVLPAREDLEEALRQLVRIGLDRVTGWMTAAETQEVSDALMASQPSIATHTLAEAVFNQPDAVVLDVRGAGEYAESHVKGAVHIAYTRLAERLAELPKGKRLLVHCGSGLRASLATAYLAREGYDAVLVDGPYAKIPAEIKTSGR